MIAEIPTADLLDPPDPVADRSMLVLQYALATIALVAALLLAIAR